MITRRREMKNFCEYETSFFITSLSPKKASKEVLLAAVRNHWAVENKLHYVKDVTFDEDRIRYYKNPALISVLRGLAISLTKLFGFKLIPKAQRFFASNQRCFFGR
jgi:predicted transposase YbfD/YdcC